MSIKIEYYFKDGAPESSLIPQTSGASGIDLRSQGQYTLWPFTATLVRTGLHIKLPEGYEAQIRSRSGLALKNEVFVLNSPGTIDSDYTGEIGVILYNASEKTLVITHGTRVAQMVIARTYTQEVKFSLVKAGQLEETERGAGGFGSTGL